MKCSEAAMKKANEITGLLPGQVLIIEEGQDAGIRAAIKMDVLGEPLDNTYVVFVDGECIGVDKSCEPSIKTLRAVKCAMEKVQLTVRCISLIVDEDINIPYSEMYAKVCQAIKEFKDG